MLKQYKIGDLGFFPTRYDRHLFMVLKEYIYSGYYYDLIELNDLHIYNKQDLIYFVKIN